jgi:hypothetical protein
MIDWEPYHEFITTLHRLDLFCIGLADRVQFLSWLQAGMMVLDQHETHGRICLCEQVDYDQNCERNLANKPKEVTNGTK